MVLSLIRYKLAPNTVLTSFVLDEEKAFDQAIKMIQNSNFTETIFKPGLEPYKGAPGDGIVYLAPFYGLENKVPDYIKTKLNSLKESIIGSVNSYVNTPIVSSCKIFIIALPCFLL